MGWLGRQDVKDVTGRVIREYLSSSSQFRITKKLIDDPL